MRQPVARDLMNREVLTARADMSVAELTTFLLENEISGAPVEDEEGRLVGVVSLTDLARAASEHGELVRASANPNWFLRGFDDGGSEDLAGYHVEDDMGLQVSQIMTPAVHSVDEETPLSDVARVMLETHVHRLLVTRDGRFAGIITTTDFVRALAGGGPGSSAALRR